MTFPPGGPAHALCAAADEALTEASFCTGELAAAERLFAEAQALAAGAGDRAGEAFAIGGLGGGRHYRNIGKPVWGGGRAGADGGARGGWLGQAVGRLAATRRRA